VYKQSRGCSKHIQPSYWIKKLSKKAKLFLLPPQVFFSGPIWKLILDYLDWSWRGRIVGDAWLHNRTAEPLNQLGRREAGPLRVRLRLLGQNLLEAGRLAASGRLMGHHWGGLCRSKVRVGVERAKTIVVAAAEVRASGCGAVGSCTSLVEVGLGRFAVREKALRVRSEEFVFVF
jgi:hypothetical protein